MGLVINPLVKGKNLEVKSGCTEGTIEYVVS